MAVLSTSSSKPDLPALAVLSVLSERECHPYEISRVIRTRHQDESLSRSGRALYHAVERLAEAGLIETVKVSREGRRPERTVYRITAEGREELHHALSDLLSNPRLGSAAFVAGVARLGHLSEVEAVSALELRLSGLEGLIAHHRAAARSLRERTKLPRLFLLEQEYLIGQLRTETTWVTATIEAVRRGELAVDQKWMAKVVSERPNFSGVPPEQIPLALRDWGQPAASPEPPPRQFEPRVSRPRTQSGQEEAHA
ncbi:MAG: PadR family transcriptional regulator [Candidatus Dormibacteria bacterium]